MEGIAPRLLSGRLPTFPEGIERIDAKVSVTALVGTDGRVNDMVVSNSSDPRYDAVCLAAVKTWRFIPAQFDNKPYAFVFTKPFMFSKLTKAEAEAAAATPPQYGLHVR